MKVSRQWLQRYVNLDGISDAELEEALPMIGLEVEAVHRLGLPPIEKLVVGEVLSREQHPDADRLGVCQVKVSPDAEPVQIVCGASNYKVGDRVPVALVGCRLPGDFKIKKSKLRGVASHGMMCSAKELGLGEDHSGLMILDERPEIGTPMNAVMTDNDTVFELELTANRGDCYSHLGVAREIAAYFNRPLLTPEPGQHAEASGESLIDSVEIASEGCPCYTAWSIRGVAIKESPKWLKQALESVGLRPINNVVDVTNFVLLETGQPLHAFDAAKIRGGKLVVRDAAPGEKLTTLDGKERSLTPEMMVIADAERPLVIAGVMGAVDAEVDQSTTDVVLESAYFNPGRVRWTTRRLNLFTDSSTRFTRDVDPAGVDTWARRAIDLILEVAGGTVTGPVLKAGAAPRGDRSIVLKPAWLRQRTGMDVADAVIRDVFTRLGFSVMENGDTFEVTVPSFRPEVDRPIDLVEEFVRLHGTETLAPQPVVAKGLHRDDSPLARFNHAAQDYLVGQHFVECCHYSLVNAEQVAKWDRPETAQGVATDNPLTSEMGCVRCSLIPGLLGALHLNQSRGNEVTRLFETGRIFRPQEGQLWEMPAVGFVISLRDHVRSWKTLQAPDFFSAKGILENVAGLAGIDLSTASYRTDTLTPLYQQGHAATLGCWRKDGWKLYVGLVSVEALKDLDVDGLALAGELVLDPDFIEKHAKRPEVKFQPLSDHPPSKKDLALQVPAEKAAESVRREVQTLAQEVAAGAFAVESVALFDVYTDEKLEAGGEKSLAFALSFRAPDRTLKDKEVNQVFEALQARLKEAGYALRA